MQTQMETTIREILKKAGLESAFDTADEFHLKVKNKHYMDLVVERHGERVSVAHYFEQNGDAMSDPQMEFILPNWMPAWIQQDPVGHYAEAIFFGEDGKILVRQKLLAELVSFSATWGRNIKAQGFAARGTFTSLTHAAVLLMNARSAKLAEMTAFSAGIARNVTAQKLAAGELDAHLEARYEELSQTDDETEPYEPSPYDGTDGGDQ